MLSDMIAFEWVKDTLGTWPLSLVEVILFLEVCRFIIVTGPIWVTSSYDIHIVINIIVCKCKSLLINKPMGVSNDDSQLWSAFSYDSSQVNWGGGYGLEVLCVYRLPGPKVYSRTSDNGPSEKRTSSLQRTHSVLRIEITIVVILKQPPRSGRFLIPDSGQDPDSQRHFSIQNCL